MEGSEMPAETPEAFLSELGKNLKGMGSQDEDLLEILKTHILKAAPARNAVTHASDAILKLAQMRANPVVPESTNG
jgi:hypothetical protein